MTPNEMEAREAAARVLDPDAFADPPLGYGEGAAAQSRESARATANETIDAYLAALSPVPDEQLDEIEAAASKAVHDRHPSWHDVGVGIVQGSHYRAGFAKGARWLAESGLLRALSSHPDEDQRTGALDFIETTILEFAEAVEDEESIATPEDARGAAELILNGLPEFGFGARAHPDEETGQLLHYKPITADELDSYLQGARPAEQELAVRVPVHVLARAVAALRDRPAEEAEWTTEADITWPGDLHPRSRIRASRDLIREANSVRDLDGTGIVGRLADMLAGWLPTPERSET